MLQCNVTPELQRPTVAPTPFEVWLNERLTVKFEAVMREPIPDELLTILAAGSNCLN